MEEREVILNETKIAFIHLPKTGGRSFQKFLSEHFKRSFILNNDKFVEYEIHNWGHFNLVEGHFPYNSINLPRMFQFVTILRDPVQRTISQYNHFMRSETSIQLAKTMREERWSFRDFISHSEMQVAAWVNNYTVYLSNYDMESDFHTATKVEEAIYNLAFNFMFVGITECMDQTIRLFNKKYGCCGDIGIEGKTPEDKKANISDEDIEAAKNALIPDITIYEMAKEIFKDALMKEGIS